MNNSTEFGVLVSKDLFTDSLNIDGAIYANDYSASYGDDYYWIAVVIKYSNGNYSFINPIGLALNDDRILISLKTKETLSIKEIKEKIFK